MIFDAPFIPLEQTAHIQKAAKYLRSLLWSPRIQSAANAKILLTWSANETATGEELLAGLWQQLAVL